MKNISIIISSIVFILMAGHTHAFPTWHTSTIKNVYPLANGDFVLKFNTVSTLCTNGSNPKYHYVTVGQNGMTSDGSVKLYSAALTAAASNKKVSIYYETDTSYCYINRMSVVF